MKYEVGMKINMELKVLGFYIYKVNSPFSYYPVSHEVYKMQDDEGNILVYDTTGIPLMEKINHGDTLKVKGTVKELGEYKGEPQVKLQRCKMEMINHIDWDKIREEKKQAKIEAQNQRIIEQEAEVVTMFYKQYKEHYSDCETVIDSFKKSEKGNCPPTINVIIPKGRMKNSGVRGQHFTYYHFRLNNNEVQVRRAVCRENAIRQLIKDGFKREEIEW